MKLWNHRTDKSSLEPVKDKEDRLHRLALQGIRATGKAMRMSGQGEAYRQEVSKQIGKSLAKARAKNPALTVADIMADHDKYDEARRN